MIKLIGASIILKYVKRENVLIPWIILQEYEIKSNYVYV